MKAKEKHFLDGVALAEQFCALNRIPMPEIERLSPNEPHYHLGTCAYYRPTTIHIMVEKCANLGMGGPAWSWPGYAVDRTPFGVIQHELGHHLDGLRFVAPDNIFSRRIFEASGEPPLTGYLGTDKQTRTFWMEWFAENFRLFVTNPSLSRALRPRFYQALLDVDIVPVMIAEWESILRRHGAPDRIVNQARNKIERADLLRAEPELSL